MGNRRRCSYCGEFRGLSHSCAAKTRARPVSILARGGIWSRVVAALSGKNSVREGVDPDKAANRHRRINEGGIFQFTSKASADELHKQFRRRRVPLGVGATASVRIYEGTKSGKILEISDAGVLMEFPPRFEGDEPRQYRYEKSDVYGEFDPEDVNTRPMRAPKDPAQLGVIRKKSRISAAFYERDVEGVVINVQGNLVTFLSDEDGEVHYVKADVCTLLPNDKN